jgi:N-acetylglutamate synthase-like GNAT family acetyltransferase
MTSLRLTVRAATLTDVEAIWRIYRATIPEGQNLNDKYWDKTIQHGGMFVAEIDGRSIGFGGIDFDSTEQIRYVYVIPGYQRSGLQVGLKILQTLEAAARQNGIETVRLHSTPSAVGFYQKAGYSAVAVEDTIGHDHPGVEMVKNLGVREQ